MFFLHNMNILLPILTDDLNSEFWECISQKQTFYVKLLMFPKNQATPCLLITGKFIHKFPLEECSPLA